MERQQLAMDLEKFIGLQNDKPIKLGDIPLDLLKEYVQCQDEMIPSAIGWHEKYGWFMLCCGQGPMIAWMEHDPDAKEKSQSKINWFDVEDD